MWETIAIIASLGGLELTLWLLGRHAQRADREMQRKQLEILDGILTELAIQNSQDDGDSPQSKAESEAGHEGGGNAIEDRDQEHLVRH